MHTTEVPPSQEQTQLPDCLPTATAEVLLADLKKLLQDNGEDYMDAFRYSMFCRRITAAQYGRPDAVEWAYDWYHGIVEEMRAQMHADFERRAAREAERAHNREQFEKGICGNPIYQAFLDTVEVPADLKNNAPYLCWHMDRTREYNLAHPLHTRMATPEYVTTFLVFVRMYADRHLAKRLQPATPAAAPQ